MDAKVFCAVLGAAMIAIMGLQLYVVYNHGIGPDHVPNFSLGAANGH